MIYRYRVSELVTNIRLMLSENFTVFEVIGEVGEISLNSKSGHIYFTIKDSDASISCVSWKGKIPNLKDFLKEGVSIKIKGQFSVFNFGAKVLVNVLEASLQGEGNIQKYMEDLKKQLEKEGFFILERKKAIPTMPKAIGIITSIDGAVIFDIKTTLQNRFPCKVFLIDVPVQGKESASSIVKAIAKFNNIPNKPDVLIIARGGGSAEDLFHFNDKELVKAIYNSNIPIITAIGHQPNSTLADLTADLSVATPTASVHFLPEVNVLKNFLSSSMKKLHDSTFEKIKNLNKQLLVYVKQIHMLKMVGASYEHELLNYNKRLNALSSHNLKFFANSLKDFESKLQTNIKQKLNNDASKVLRLKSLLGNKNKVLAQSAMNLVIKSNKLEEYKYKIQFYEDKLAGLNRILENLSFRSTLKRGYSVVYKNGIVVKAVADITEGNYKIELYDGLKEISIAETSKKLDSETF